MWYMGKEFDKEKNKEYKTLEGGLKAAQKQGLNLYDEDGNVVTEKGKEPDALQEDAGANFEAQADKSTQDTENGQDGAQSDAEGGNKTEDVHGKIRRVFNGKLRLRRSPSWAADAICGVTMFDEKTVDKKIIVDGVPMYHTIDGYYVSGKPEHVEFVKE